MSFIIQRSKGLICNDSSKLGIIYKQRFIHSPDNMYFQVCGKYNRYLSTSKDLNSLLSIPFEKRFEHYHDYLSQNVTLEFMEKYYSQYTESELFINFINTLPPTIRTEKETIEKLFELINSLNTSKDKLALISVSINNKPNIFK